MSLTNACKAFLGGVGTYCHRAVLAHLAEMIFFYYDDHAMLYIIVFELLDGIQPISYPPLFASSHPIYFGECHPLTYV